MSEAKKGSKNEKPAAMGGVRGGESRFSPLGEPGEFISPGSSMTGSTSRENLGKCWKCGYISLIGRPNVGKSTLLNHLVGTKVSITSRKPQTTRHRILGIHTVGEDQFVFVDTPGLHQQEKKALNKHLNRAALHALHGVDLIFWVVEALQWTSEEDWILEQLKKFTDTPVILVVNKIDRVKPIEKLLPYLDSIKDKYPFRTIIPISALHKQQLDVLCKEALPYFPVREHDYDPTQTTNRDNSFRITEIIREKLMRQLGQELPYSLTVTIEKIIETDVLYKISAVIWVERQGQKVIVIGQGGAALKSVGQNARLDLEKLFGKKVFLQLWVKIEEGWSDSAKMLAKLGYQE